MIIYLYHKRHLKTGLNYFGKTTSEPYTYAGSGKYWKRHLNKHGLDIETVSVWEFQNQEDCTDFALRFSTENDIVESKDWANLKAENGKDGGDPGPAGRKKIAEAHVGRKHSVEQNKQKSNRQTGIKRSPEYLAKKVGKKYKKSKERTAPNKNKGRPLPKAWVEKSATARRGMKYNIVTCPHCNKQGGSSSMPRWHFDNCKLKSYTTGGTGGSVGCNTDDSGCACGTNVPSLFR
jgi:hypothetical protein